MRFVSGPVLTLALTSCADGEGAPRSAFGEVEPLASPAGEGSSEAFLSPSGDGVLMSWWEKVGDVHELRVSVLGGEGWSRPSTVTSGSDFFVNWADFPSVAEVAPGVLAAHWLQRGGSGHTYDYGVRVAVSRDRGRTWSGPWTPHEDGTPTEHGFVSLFPLEAGSWGLVWLDGRSFVSEDGTEPAREMALRFRRVGADGEPGPEVLVDGRICECCQTASAVTSSGPIVVYRNRTEDEIRDIYVTRLVDGAWTAGVPVHDDDWHIGGCPVNGPAAAALGSDVAVAWFTGAGDVPRVRVAFSTDAGESFGAPVTVDDGDPAGRVDVVLSADGSALVSWLERTGGGDAEVRVRRIERNGRVGPSTAVTRSSDARASGFPRMVEGGDGALLFAWTDVSDGGSRVRVSRAALEDG